MSPPLDPASRARTVAWTVALACVPALLGLWRVGMDANWDLRNYHLYNAHAWLTGRAAIDIAPAQLQSFHNPLLDLPLYGLVSTGAPLPLVGLWLLLPTIACLLLLLHLQRRLSPTPPGRAAQVVLVLLAISGAATWSMLGSSMNDPFVAAAVLGALALVLDVDPGAGARRWAVAGLLAGAIAGMKLTAVAYCIGLAAAALVAGGGWRPTATRMAALALGGASGFALTYGYWALHLYQLYGNPFFPYFNDLFASPDAPPYAWTDPRFRAHGVWDALTSPLQLLQNTQHFSEMKLRDPRLFGAIAGLGTLGLVTGSPGGEAIRRKLLCLVAFAIASWLPWAWQYGIYRYAMPLELLGALALVLLAQRLPRYRLVGLLVLLVVVSADTRRPDWNRKRWDAPIVPTAIDVPTDALVVSATGEPLAYLALALPRSVPFLALSNNFLSPDECRGLQSRAQARLAAHHGPVYLLAGDRVEPALQLLVSRYGLAAQDACRPLEHTLEPAQLCPLRRVAWVPSCAPASGMALTAPRGSR